MVDVWVGCSRRWEDLDHRWVSEAPEGLMRQGLGRSKAKGRAFDKGSRASMGFSSWQIGHKAEVAVASADPCES